MSKQMITKQLIENFLKYLTQEEKSSNTIKKYRRALEKLFTFSKGQELKKEIMLKYKEMLCSQGYKARSINGFLTAANRFLKYMGWKDAKIKTCRIQKEAFRQESRELSKEEYKKLLEAAKCRGKERLYYILKTIYSTGVRVSELLFVTVESVRQGYAEIRCKGKIRSLLFPARLQKELLKYINKKGIKSGIIFCTRNGNPVDRSNLWKEMKRLSEYIQEQKYLIAKSKIFPHNLRHLFAQNFYQASKDIAKLADILGHSSIETTRIYVKTGYGEYKKLLDEMETMG